MKLHLAAANNDITSLKLYLDQGIDINSKGNNGESALFSACLNNANEAAQFLIERGIDKKIRDNHGNLALDVAEFRKNQFLINLIK